MKKKKKAAPAAADDAEEAAAPEPPPVSAAAGASEAAASGKKKRKKGAQAEAPAAPAAPAVADPEPVAGKKKKRQRAESGEAPVAAEAAADAEAESAEAEEPARKKGKKGKAGAAASSAPADAAPAQSKKPALEPLKPAAKQQADDCTVFVSGVPYTFEVEKIHDMFGKCGKVLEVRAPTWQDSGRLRGYAHITFEDSKARAEAIAMDGVKVGAKGRYLKIEAAKAPDSSKAAPAASAQDLAGKRRLFVKNLPYDATEVDIKELFGSFGKIADVRVPTSFGRSKGFAYIEYARSESLQKAVTTGAELKGRRLYLDADSGDGPKAGFHYRASAFEQPDVKFKAPYAGKGKGGKGGGKGGKGPRL